MVYVGGKRLISKDVLPFLLRHRKPGQYWVEPFVGGGNMIDKVTHKRIGADINPYVIDALKAIRDNIDDLPRNNKEFTENDYYDLKNGWNYKYKGYAGFAFSFGGKWLSGWCRNKEKRDYVRTAYNNARKQSPRLHGVKLVVSSYLDLDIPDNSIIYCDPPYMNTLGYNQTFDSSVFWQWCRDKASEGHTVYVSEQNAPKGFKCVWEKCIPVCVGGTGVRKERLFFCG
jgi:DNA adenine methylase